jgi:hypothetical protein
METLRNYIRERVRSLPIGDMTDLGAGAANLIEERANGVFLWAKLTLDMLRDKKTEEEIEKCLRGVPNGIDAMLGHALDMHSVTLSGSSSDEFYNILFWLTHSSGSLAMSELANMLKSSLYKGQQAVGLERRIRHEYSSLLTVSMDDGLTTAMLRNREQCYRSILEATKVAFSHAYIGEYLSCHPHYTSEARPDLLEVLDLELGIAGHMKDRCIQSLDMLDLESTVAYLKAVYITDKKSRWEDIMSTVTGLSKLVTDTRPDRYTELI